MRKYKLDLIKPTQLIDGKPLKYKKAFILTRALPYIASLTPSEFEVSIIDDTVEDIDYDKKVDLVGITSLIPQVPRAIQIANNFKNRGVKVVMGGVGASSVRDEVLPYVDSLVVGEAENVWLQLLEDFKGGCLKKIYHSIEPVSLQKMPIPRFELLPLDKYMKPGRFASKNKWPRIPIETARGCPHNCDYCYSPLYFGRKVRYRPIKEVVSEIERFEGDYFFIVDDNVNSNPGRAKELFKALKPLKIHWTGQFSTLAAKDEELLGLARESGCVTAFVGVESLSYENLKSVNKEFNLHMKTEQIFVSFKNAGIDLLASLMMGFDGDTSKSIDETIDFLIDQKVHMLYLFILTPLPGTRLHSQFERDKRILHKDFSRYDTTHVVFRPKNMEPEELEEKYWESFAKFYSFPSIMQRFSSVSNWFSPSVFPTYLHTFMGNLFFRKAISNRIHPLSGGIAKSE